MKNFTVEQLAKATGAARTNAQTFYSPLLLSMEQFRIDTTQRQAQFLATVSVESTALSTTEEGLYYRDAKRLAAIYPRAFKTPAEAQPYLAKPKALGALLYGGFWGRGLIQLTWEKNYEAAGKALGFDYLKTPELVLQPKHAALTAAWFWATNGCNEAADKDVSGDMRAVTRIVNGKALMHLKERKAQFDIAKGVLV